MTARRFALIGTRGVPARYGGFETAVEEIGSRLVERGHEVDVYCRNLGQNLKTYRGMRLINVPAVRMRTVETLSHTGLSVLHAGWRRPDAAIVFNAANSPFLPLLKLRRIPVAMHMDGLEWKRAKWAGAGARYYRRAEAVAARSGVPLIADARGIADYLSETYDRPSHFIPYGASVVHARAGALDSLGLALRGYHLVVARFEPENHVAEILRGYADAGAERPLVVVGSNPYDGDYQRLLERLASAPNIRMLGAVWDQDLLDQLYAGSLSYLHGHSVGGTNPSLLRALGAGAPVTAFDVNFNREVTGGHGRFFADPDQVAAAVLADEADPSAALYRGATGQRYVAAAYRWDRVTDDYETLLQDLAQGDLPS